MNLSLDTAIKTIEKTSGFTDESTPVGEAWAVVLQYISGSSVQSGSVEVLLDNLGRMSRRWKRGCGRPGVACVQQQWANSRADDRVKVCVKELEDFIVANKGEKQ